MAVVVVCIEEMNLAILESTTINAFKIEAEMAREMTVVHIRTVEIIITTIETTKTRVATVVKTEIIIRRQRRLTYYL